MELYRAAFVAGGPPTRHLVCVGRVASADDPAEAVAYQRWMVRAAGPEIAALGSYLLRMVALEGRLLVSAKDVCRHAQT